jgi:hypothetical protein
MFGSIKWEPNFLNTRSSFKTFPQFAGIIYRNLLVQFTVIAENYIKVWNFCRKFPQYSSRRVEQGPRLSTFGTSNAGARAKKNQE